MVVVAAFAALCAAFIAMPMASSNESANHPSYTPDCFAGSSPNESLARVIADPTRWNCDLSAVSLIPERTVLRIPLNRDGSVPPRYFSSLAIVSGNIVVALVNDQGRILTHTEYSPAQLTTARIDNRFLIPLPKATQNSDAVIVAFDDPISPAIFTRSRLLDRDPADEPGAVRLLLMVAIVCGLLAMPMAYNVAFYPVLRERFVLWHVILSLALLAQCMLSSGIALHFVDLSVEQLFRSVVITFGIAVAGMCAFTEAFIEPGKLNPRLRKLMRWVPLWVIGVSLVHAFFPTFMRVIQVKLYYAAFIPVAALLIGALVDALRRGSRSAEFKLIGLTPFIAMGGVRLITMLLPGLSPEEAMPMLYVAIVVEGMAATLGVAHRFMRIKRQRDDALAETRIFEDLAERDPLTGLLNRRAIERNFDQLRAEGFRVCALIDLDYFKSINDSYGHAKGDEVLRSVAGALREDEDTLAVRMGGEEFMLLLRGVDARNRAEGRRQAITRHVAADVVGLERPVTASMGLLEMPERGQQNVTFETLYTRADRLLYDAKAGGRNRTIGEKMVLFSARGKDRRTLRRRAA